MWAVDQRDLEGLDSYCSLHIRESGKFLLVEFEILGFGIRKIAQGIRNPTKDWNLKSKFHWQRQESSTWNPESTAWDPEFKTFLDSLHGTIFFFRLDFSTEEVLLSFIHRRWLSCIILYSPWPLHIKTGFFISRYRNICIRHSSWAIRGPAK